MSETLLLYILLIHFLADFGLQTHDQATNKANDIKYLIYHTGVYSIIWLLASYIFLNDITKAIQFAYITFLTHTVTDMLTANIGKPFWKKNDYHNGFAVVGFDQMLHYIQLYLTFKFLI